MNKAIQTLLALLTAAVCGLALFLCIFILAKGLPHLDWQFLTTVPSWTKGTQGIGGDILNTVAVVVLTLAILLPVGIASAVYLEEYCEKEWLKALVEWATGILAGIPSIIFGLAGMLVFCQYMGLKTSLFAGCLTLAVMNLPIVVRTVRESLQEVPQLLKEGAYGLGAGKWTAIRTVILPTCINGIVTGCVLAAGRIVGESAALLFTAGFSHSFAGIFSPGSTLSVALYVQAREHGDFEHAFASAAVLLVLCAGLNLLARRLERKLTK